MIGKLQYVVHTRPNIALAVSMVARFSANSKENHMMEVKRIMIYLKAIEEYGLWYKIGGNLDLKVFKILIGQEVLVIERALVVEHSFLVKE